MGRSHGGIRSTVVHSSIYDRRKNMNSSQVDPASLVPLKRGPLGSRHRELASNPTNRLVAALLLAVALVLGFTL